MSQKFFNILVVHAILQCVSRVFTNSPEDRSSIPVIPKTQKIVDNVKGAFRLPWTVVAYFTYKTWPKQGKVTTLISSIEVVGALTRCALIHSACDLKTTQMNIQLCLIWELMLCEFKLGRNVAQLPVGVVEYVNCIFDMRVKTLPPTSILDMIVNNLMVKLLSWSSRECRVPLCCHYSQVHSDPK